MTSSDNQQYLVVSEKFASTIAEGASANKKYETPCGKLRNAIAIPIKITKTSTRKLGVLSLFLRNPFAIKLPIPNKTIVRNKSGATSSVVLVNAKVSKKVVGR
jgi:hypothetical protein